MEFDAAEKSAAASPAATDPELAKLLYGRDEFSLTIQVDDAPPVEFLVSTNYEEYQSGERVMQFGPTPSPKPGSPPTNCITINFDEGNLWLDDYYFKVPRANCPPLDHALFFKIIDFLSFYLNVPTRLADLSKKTVNHCYLDRTILMLVKGKSFYERYDFENEAVQKILTSHADVPLPEPFSTEVVKHTYSLNQYPDLRDLPVVEKMRQGSATLREVAQFIYTLCERSHPITEIYFFTTFRRSLEGYIDSLLQRQYVYTREISGVQYSFQLEPTGAAAYALMVRTVPPRGGKKSRKRRVRSRRRRVRRRFTGRRGV